MKARYYCTCGAAFTLTGPLHIILPMLATFMEAHRESGHQECDAATAARARRAADVERREP